jgi:hypothetical protein
LQARQTAENVMVSRQIKAQRLQHLREVIEGAPTDRFNMTAVQQESECGIAYCAAGWAAQDPRFKAEGLSLTVGSGELTPPNYDIGLERVTGWQAIERFFYLSRSEVSIMFGLDLLRRHVVLKSQVIANVDRILAGVPPEPYS